MGPQPFGCGRYTKESKEAYIQTGFNGAATFRLRKVTAVIALACHYLGFNGAATFRLRKEPDTGANECDDGASMGPQPFGCGRRSVALELYGGP